MGIGNTLEILIFFLFERPLFDGEGTANTELGDRELDSKQSKGWLSAHSVSLLVSETRKLFLILLT